jgi:hypothetical protein
LGKRGCGSDSDVSTSSREEGSDIRNNEFVGKHAKMPEKKCQRKNAGEKMPEKKAREKMSENGRFAYKTVLVVN